MPEGAGNVGIHDEGFGTMNGHVEFTIEGSAAW